MGNFTINALSSQGSQRSLDTAGRVLENSELHCSALLTSCSRLLKLTAQKFTHEAAVFQNSPTGYILNHRFWTRVSEQIFDQLTENCLRCFKYEHL